MPYSKAQLRVATYNTATSGENSSPIRPRESMDIVLRAIGAESVNGIATPIDVLLLQEQSTTATTTRAFADLLNEIHGVDSYQAGRVNARTNGGGRSGVVYNSATVELIAERAFGTLSGGAQSRQTMRYQIRPVGYDERSDIFAYVNHYKAGTSATDQQRRNVEANTLRDNADALGTNKNVIYAGDFNIRSCQEDMFQTLLATGNGKAIDPVGDFGTGCEWNNNSSLRGLHTQSPADGFHGGLVQGGVDDRFDFQLVTEELFDGEGISLIPGSYHAFGNNGTHRLNQPINDSNNQAASRAVLDALASASDHLPVVADYQLPAKMQVDADPIPSLVLRDSELSIDVRISNVAPAVHQNGADELDYAANFTPIGFPTTSFQDSVTALATADVVSFTLPTSKATNIGFGLDVVSNSEGVMNGTFVQTGNYRVIDPAVASFAADGIETQGVFDLGIVAQFSDIEVESSIYNLSTLNGAALDLDSLIWSTDEPSWESTLETFGNLAPQRNFDFKVIPDTTNLGTISNGLSLVLSDQDGIFGERNFELTLSLTAQIALGGDANLDDEVGFLDFLILSQSFGQANTEWRSGDFTADGLTDFGDFLVLSRNFGTIARGHGFADGPTATVPEPQFSLALLLCIFATIRVTLARESIRVSERAKHSN